MVAHPPTSSPGATELQDTSPHTYSPGYRSALCRRSEGDACQRRCPLLSRAPTNPTSSDLHGPHVYCWWMRLLWRAVSIVRVAFSDFYGPRVYCRWMTLLWRTVSVVRDASLAYDGAVSPPRRLPAAAAVADVRRLGAQWRRMRVDASSSF